MIPANAHDFWVIPADHQSIFSDTVHGVPSPTIPHEHPYPTRFHGPIYHYPRFFRPYREQSYVVPPEYTGPGLEPKWPEPIPFGNPEETPSWMRLVALIGIVGVGYILYRHLHEGIKEERARKKAYAEYRPNRRRRSRRRRSQ